MQNSIFTIYPYRTEGNGWAFDDETVGLVREPFVAGADDLLSLLSGGAPKMAVTFSDQWFPDHLLVLEQMTKEELVSAGILRSVDDEVPSGTFYKQPEREHMLWLCPALNKYYSVSPETIYFKFKCL